MAEYFCAQLSPEVCLAVLMHHLTVCQEEASDQQYKWVTSFLHLARPSGSCIQTFFKMLTWFLLRIYQLAWSSGLTSSHLDANGSFRNSCRSPAFLSVCCSVDRFSRTLVTVLLPVFSWRQRFEVSVCPFDQARGWLQLELYSSCAGRQVFDSCTCTTVLLLSDH